MLATSLRNSTITTFANYFMFILWIQRLRKERCSGLYLNALPYPKHLTLWTPFIVSSLLLFHVSVLKCSTLKFLHPLQGLKNSASTVGKKQQRSLCQTLSPTMKKPKKYKPQWTKKAIRMQRSLKKKSKRYLILANRWWSKLELHHRMLMILINLWRDSIRWSMKSSLKRKKLSLIQSNLRRIMIKTSILMLSMPWEIAELLTISSMQWIGLLLSLKLVELYLP